MELILLNFRTNYYIPATLLVDSYSIVMETVSLACKQFYHRKREFWQGFSLSVTLSIRVKSLWLNEIIFHLDHIYIIIFIFPFA